MTAASDVQVLHRYRAQTVRELRTVALRRVLLGVLLLSWATSAPFTLPTARPGLVFCLAAFGLASASFWLLSRHYRLSAGLLLLGLLLLGVVITYVYPEQPVPYFLSLIVAAGVFLLGPCAGALLAGAITASLLLMVHLTGFPLPLSTATGGALLAWCVLAIVWQGAEQQATLVSWSWHSYSEAQARAAELQERQAKLAQVLKDLDVAYEQLAAVNRKLALSKSLTEEARRAKAEFVANVSHELRTPINMIIGFTEMIVRTPRTYARGGLPPTLQADLDVVLRNAEHLSDLINDILDLSQLDVGRMGLAKEWASLAEIAKTAVEAITPLARTRGLPITLETDDGLPPVYVDRTRVRQVLLNLLSNAVRFTDEGQVRVTVRRQDDHIVASVTDTGPGISPDDIPKLFEPFRQLDGSVRRRYGGTGLGLHISRSFVTLHGGEMGVESHVGRGTTIRFTLPIEDRVPFSPLQRGRQAGPDPGPGSTFVVVEPQPVIEGLLRRYLDDGTVIRAADLDQAIEVSRSRPTQAIALRASHADEAWRLLEQAGHMRHNAPLIACSMPGAVEAYSEGLGLAGYLLKPVTRRQLLDALGQLPSAHTLLIVDDDPDFLRLFARMLRSARQRYTVWQATSAAEALALLQSRRPDVIFLDVLLPDLEGPALLGRIRSQEALRDIPVFFVTACDAAGRPLVASFLGVTHRGGLSADELMRCIQALGQALHGAIPPADREQPEALPG